MVVIEINGNELKEFYYSMTSISILLMSIKSIMVTNPNKYWEARENYKNEMRINDDIR